MPSVIQFISSNMMIFISTLLLVTYRLSAGWGRVGV
jgi:hypothetical protein